MFTFLYVIFFLTNYFHILLYLFSINSMTLFYNTTYWFLSHPNYKSYLFISILFFWKYPLQTILYKNDKIFHPLYFVKYLFLIMVCIFDMLRALWKNDWYSIILEDVVLKHFISIQHIDIESVWKHIYALSFAIRKWESFYGQGLIHMLNGYAFTYIQYMWIILTMDTSILHF